MRHHGIERLDPAGKASIGHDKNRLDCDERPMDGVLTLGVERRIQSLDGPVIGMIDGGVSALGGIPDDMPVDDWPFSV